MSKAAIYIIGALVLAGAVWFSTSHGHVAPTEPETALTSPCDPVYELSSLPAGVVGYYHPHTPTGPQEAFGELPEGAPYHVIGRHGTDWLYIRLPEGWGYAGSGQLWVHAAAVTGLDVSRVPDYAGGH